MQTALKMKTRVLPGNRIEVTSPELTEGEEVEISVSVHEGRTSHFTLREIAESIEPGPRQFETWEAYQGFLRNEKDSWVR